MGKWVEVLLGAQRKEGGFGGGVFFWRPSRAVRFSLLEARGGEASAGFQRVAGARSGRTHCTACFGKDISCSKLELKLQDQ